MAKSSEMGPKEYWSVLRRRKLLILASIAVWIALALGLNAFTTPVYRARTQIVIDKPPTRSMLTGEPLETSTSQSDNLALFTAAALIDNRTQLAGVVDSLRSQGVTLEDPPSKNPLEPLVAGIIAKIAPPPPATGAGGEDAALKAQIDWLESKLSVEPVRDTRLVNIYVEHSNPRAAEKIANKEYQLSGPTQAGYFALDARLKQLTETAGELQRNLTRSDADLAKAREIYKEEHPKLVALESEHATIVQNIADGERQMREINAQLQQYTTLQADLKSNQDLYNLLQLKLQEAQLNGRRDDPLVRVVEPAAAEPGMVRPRKALNLMIGIVIGLLCGVGLALIRETLRRTIRTPQDVEDQLQLPVLGLIPKGA